MRGTRRTRRVARIGPREEKSDGDERALGRILPDAQNQSPNFEEVGALIFDTDSCLKTHCTRIEAYRLLYVCSVKGAFICLFRPFVVG